MSINHIKSQLDKAHSDLNLNTNRKKSLRKTLTVLVIIIALSAFTSSAALIFAMIYTSIVRITHLKKSFLFSLFFWYIPIIEYPICANKEIKLCDAAINRANNDINYYTNELQSLEVKRQSFVFSLNNH